MCTHLHTCTQKSKTYTRLTGDRGLGYAKESRVWALGTQSLPLPKSSQRERHFQFLQLVAAVEQHQQKFRSQASVIDEIVDTAFEVNGAGEDEERKRGF